METLPWSDVLKRFPLLAVGVPSLTSDDLCGRLRADLRHLEVHLSAHGARSVIDRYRDQISSCVVNSNAARGPHRYVAAGRLVFTDGCLVSAMAGCDSRPEAEREVREILALSAAQRNFAPISLPLLLIDQEAGTGPTTPSVTDPTLPVAMPIQTPKSQPTSTRHLDEVIARHNLFPRQAGRDMASAIALRRALIIQAVMTAQGRVDYSCDGRLTRFIVAEHVQRLATDHPFAGDPNDDVAIVTWIHDSLCVPL